MSQNKFFLVSFVLTLPNMQQELKKYHIQVCETVPHTGVEDHIKAAIAQQFAPKEAIGLAIMSYGLTRSVQIMAPNTDHLQNYQCDPSNEKEYEDTLDSEKASIVILRLPE